MRLGEAVERVAEAMLQNRSLLRSDIEDFPQRRWRVDGSRGSNGLLIIVTVRYLPAAPAAHIEDHDEDEGEMRGDGA